MDQPSPSRIPALEPAGDAEARLADVAQPSRAGSDAAAAPADRRRGELAAPEILQNRRPRRPKGPSGATRSISAPY
ncbi:MAG TPA: hypothetical protein VGW34_10645 [Allosphingosinicella sp.]|nr:hypothetical protein [Allosphingosinicella sp.]